MLDWYLVLTPLLLLPIVGLLVFVGCALTHHGYDVNLSLHNPRNLTINKVQFSIRRTSSGSTPTTTNALLELIAPTTRSLTGDDVAATYRLFISPPTMNSALYALYIFNPYEGTWTVSCSVFVQNSAGTVFPPVSRSYTPRAVMTSHPETFGFQLQVNTSSGANEVILV